MYNHSYWSIMNILTMNNVTIMKIIFILFPCILAIGIISWIIKRKILAKSIFCAILISGILILINFICPFLSIKTNYGESTGMTLHGGCFDPPIDYTSTRYIGIFGIDYIRYTSKSNDTNNYEDIVLWQDNNYIPNDRKEFNIVIVFIEYIIIFIILFIIFRKQRTSIDYTEEYDNKYSNTSNSIKFIFMYRDESGNEIRATGSEFFDQEYEFKDLDLSNASIAHAFVIWKKKLQEKGQIEWEHINGSGSIFLKQIN